MDLYFTYYIYIYIAGKAERKATKVAPSVFTLRPLVFYILHSDRLKDSSALAGVHHNQHPQYRGGGRCLKVKVQMIIVSIWNIEV